MIVTQLIDNLYKGVDEIAQEVSSQEDVRQDVRNEIKEAVGNLSRFKYKLQTNKALELFDENREKDDLDVFVWNNFIRKLPEDDSTFYFTCWLYAECYVYRRLRQFFENFKILGNFDYFHKQKFDALQSSLQPLGDILVITRFKNLSPEEKEMNFHKFLRVDLWGNRNDLSISLGKAVEQNKDNIFEVVESYDSFILSNDSVKVWEHLACEFEEERIVDFVLDNVGMELVSDFLLADFLLEQKLCTKVRFHVKVMPWFISDVTATDFDETIKEMSKVPGPLSDFADKLQGYLKEEKLLLMPKTLFWTWPYEFYEMANVDEKLYNTLQESYLVIFKGDLNYRKLLGDFLWDFTEDFGKCLKGFLPSSVCSLRTIKADLVCGLQPGVAEKLDAQNPKWMYAGEYGVIQFQGEFGLISEELIIFECLPDLKFEDKSLLETMEKEEK